MPHITINNLFERRINYNLDHTSILNCIHQNGIDWMHACGGKGRCTTCAIRVIEGMTAISAINEHEMRFKKIGKLGDDERLACQCQIKDDITVEVLSANKLPHMKYSN